MMGAENMLAALDVELTTLPCFSRHISQYSSNLWTPVGLVVFLATGDFG